MNVYICQKCGFFGFSMEGYGKLRCAHCGKFIHENEQASLSETGMDKYLAIKPGLADYEETRCGKKQITLFG